VSSTRWGSSIYWRVAESRLPAIKARSLAAPSPFETIPRDQWIAESADAFAVDDVDPQAPVHFLVVPKERVTTLLDAKPELLGQMLGLARDVAAKRAIAADGFRVVINTNPRGAQSVYHLHMHVLGGRQMRWPPG
jgi:histidine triad (HIT) family protein